MFGLTAWFGTASERHADGKVLFSMTGLTAQAIEFAKARGIGMKTLTDMLVVGGKARFDDGAHEAIVFRYLDERGEQCNFKARSLDGKRYKQAKGGRQIAYNWWQVRDGDLRDVWIVEGEFDACALVEAGIPKDAVISTPVGAPDEASDDPAESKKYGWLLDAMEDGLEKATRYILASDNDGPGRAFRSDCVRILGAAKACYVDWPEGIKDANEFLVEYGPEKLHGYLDCSVKPWPVRGLYRLSEIPEPAPLELWDTGFPEIEGKIKLAPTLVSAVTGYPGHGKSHLMQQIWFNIAREHGIRVAIFSAETRLKPFLRRNMRQFFHRKAEWQMNEADKRRADEWIEAHILFMELGDEAPTMPWLVDTIEVAAQRHGCRAALVDPWNKLEEDYDPRQMTETRWIGQSLDVLIAMSRGLSIHTQIIAHPAKPDATMKKLPPDLYSISGSSHWNNRVDQGFCVHREKFMEGGKRVTASELFYLKSRYTDELGYPSSYSMNYDLERGIFHCTDYETKLQAGLREIG
jgi:twinkle protein